MRGGSYAEGIDTSDRNPKNSFDDVVRELQEIKENDEQYSNDNTELLLQIDDTIQKTSDAAIISTKRHRHYTRQNCLVNSQTSSK